jgi:thioredoxin 1
MSTAQRDALPSSFDELVHSADVPVLVDFWADWCAPCRMLAPVVHKIAHAFRGRLLVIKVDTEEKPEIAGAYQIESIPTIMMFWKGEPVMRLTGAHPYDVLVAEIERAWPAAAR